MLAYKYAKYMKTYTYDTRLGSGFYSLSSLSSWCLHCEHFFLYNWVKLNITQMTVFFLSVPKSKVALLPTLPFTIGISRASISVLSSTPRHPLGLTKKASTSQPSITWDSSHAPVASSNCLIARPSCCHALTIATPC